MPKEIDVSNISSMIDLKAEYLRKQAQQKRSTKPSAASKQLYIPSKKPFLVDKSKVSQKKSKLSRERQIKIEQLEEAMREEEKQLRLSREKLEEKARIYEKLSTGQMVEDTKDEDERFLVNFDQKVRDKEDEEEEMKLAAEKSNNDDEELVEYTDSLGRVRHCMPKDLPKFIEADKQLKQRTKRPITEDCKPSTSGNYNKKGELLSTDMTRELQRQNWEEETKEIGQTHYQHVAKDEAWEHGVGYFKFSRDEATRAEQMQEFDKMRKQTMEQRNRNQRLKDKRKQMMEERLARVKKRKNLNTETDPDAELLRDETPSPILDQSNLAQIPLPEESAAEVERKNKEEVEKAKQKRLEHVRPWDEDKKKIMSQQIWVGKQREERKQEFAPPVFNY